MTKIRGFQSGPTLHIPTDSAFTIEEKKRVVVITLPYPPSLNDLYGFNRRTGKRYKKEAHRVYTEIIQTLVKVKKIKPFVDKVFMDMKFYRPRKRGDIDNYFKTIWDALATPDDLATHGMYLNDEQIFDLRARKYDTDRRNPRVEIECFEIEE